MGFYLNICNDFNIPRLIYSHYKNFWLPLAFHFGNNLTESTIQTNTEMGAFLGSDGYLVAIILAERYIFYSLKIKKSI